MPKAILKATWFYVLLIILLTLPLCQDFIKPHLINGHDSLGGYFRALSMYDYSGHGQWLVRWSPDINWGYGYPMFNFYPPFFSMMAAFINIGTHNIILAINLACILFWILSGIGMFLLAREFWGPEGGMLSALLYVYAPYHIIDLYVRGAFAEFSSFAIFPFLLLSIVKISQNQGRGWVILALFSTWALSLTHNIMSMLFFPIAVAFIIYLYFMSKEKKWVLTAFSVLAVGLMMSSFFWLPALVEKQYLNLNFLVGMRYDFAKNFISLRDLFWPFHVRTADNISFGIGLIHTLIWLASLVVLFKIFKKNKPAAFNYIFFLAVGLAAIFFTLSSSHLFWEKIKILGFVQFPWRFLTIIVFAVSLLGGSLALVVENILIKRIGLIVLGILVIGTAMHTAPKPNFMDSPIGMKDFVAMGEGEYTPKWVMVPPGQRPPAKFQIVHGTGQIGAIETINPVHFKTQIQAGESCAVLFHSFYFPGWKVNVDGRATNPFIVNNPIGAILFYVPAGNHEIEVIFGPTPIRRMAAILAWIGLALNLLLITFAKCYEHQN